MGNPAVDAMVKILEPLKEEYTGIANTISSSAEKRQAAKQEVLEGIDKLYSPDDFSKVLLVVNTVRETLEKYATDKPTANWVVLRNYMKPVIELINEMADGHIDAKLSEKFKSVSGDSETLRAKAKEIKEKYEALAASVKILDPKVTVEDLPKLGSGGRPAGTGKHQVNKGRFTFFVNDVEQSATKISTVLLSASAKCGGSGTNGSYSVKEFMTLLKETVPGLQSEYDKDWSITLKNGSVLKGQRKMEAEDNAE